MSQRLSGRVGALVLGSITAITACGARDSLFVPGDEGFSAGQAGSLSVGGVGNLSAGGRAGSVSAAGRGGSIGLGGHVGFAGSPAGGFHAGGSSFAGSFSTGGALFGGAGGLAGFGNVAGVGGAPPSWCDVCMKLNIGNTDPCNGYACDLQQLECVLVGQNDGVPCSDDSNLCTRSTCKSGQCVAPTGVCLSTECIAGSCDPTTGQCIETPIAAQCDDGDPCTVKDECTAGKCTPGFPVPCGINNDNCCPAGCGFNLDNDCSPSKQIVLTASDRGWYQGNGFHNPLNKNTFTGFSQRASYNSFFNFDLSQVKGTIVAAQLAVVEDTFYGTDPSETVSVWDVKESADELSSTSASVAIYQDLQNGIQYGSFNVSPGLVGSSIDASLSAQAVADLNGARGGSFSVGLHIDTLSGRLTGDEGVRFSSDTEPRDNQLILSVQQ